jgi:hypothetical protein
MDLNDLETSLATVTIAENSSVGTPGSNIASEDMIKRRDHVLSLPPHSYSQLPGPNDAIRLVRIHNPDPPSPGLPICSLEIHFLDLHPPFCALSYTWGASEDLRDHLDDEDALAELNDQSQYAIVLDGQLFSVRRNLQDFLVEISGQLEDPDFEGYDLYWIDAICINQSDLEERNEQVNKMGEIYREAHDVLVWLGSDFRDEMITVRNMMVRVVEMGAHVTQASVEADISAREFWTTEADHQALFLEFGLPDLDNYLWFTLCIFFKREWFSRLWVRHKFFAFRQHIGLINGAALQVFQEVALARHITTLCGRTKFEIMDIDECASVLRWGLDVELGQKWLINLLGQFRPAAAAVQTVCQVMRWCQLRSTPYRFDEWVWSALVGTTIVSTPAAVWGVLLEVVCGVKSTEPVDQVYALLGVSRHLSQTHQEEIENNEPETLVLRVDYSKGASEVFTDITTLVMLGTQWLNMLCRVQRNSIGHDDIELPSWVPDFSCSTASRIFLNSKFFNATRSLVDGELDSSLPLFSIQRRTELHTSGFKLGTICAVSNLASAATGQESFNNIAGILAACPETYPFTKRPERRTTALWKTMAAWPVGTIDNVWSFEEIERIESSSFHMVLASCASVLDECDTDSDIRALLTEKLPNIQLVAGDHGTGCIPSHDDIFTEVVHRSRARQDGISDGDPEGYVSKAYQRGQEYRLRMGKYSTSRRFFKTEEGYIGIGPDTAEVGDEVWLIPRATVPFVLRRAGDRDRSHDTEKAGTASDNYFHLVGESYVHGAMHGEVFDRMIKEKSTSDWEWSMIVLV